MALNGTMVKIDSVTVGSGGIGTIEFTNIPQTYTDLQIVLSPRNNADNYGGFYMRFNGSSTSYSARRLRGDGSSAASDTSLEIGWPGSGFTASTFGNVNIYIPNYTSSNNKSASIEYVAENNGTSTRMGMSAYLWSNTAAITSVAFSVFDNNFPNDKFVQYSTATLYGISRTTAQIKATGGTVYDDADYTYHLFTSSGTFTPTQNLTADILVIAGGGGGGTSTASDGGGGAGGLVFSSATSLTATNYTVTIGAGGAASNGSDSSFTGVTTAVGGGRGGVGSGATGSNGGSGGGGGYNVSTGGTATSGQGFAGGNGTVASTGGAGGGGGAGGAGSNSTSPVGGNGGVGSSSYSSWGAATSTGQLSGGVYYYAGGGGGQGRSPSAGGNGGLGGGGTGSISGSGGTSGLANTGGGSGAALNASGGSGVIIVRYRK